MTSLLAKKTSRLTWKSPSSLKERGQALGREIRTQLPHPAHGQAHPVLPARFVVHSGHGNEGRMIEFEQHNHVEAREHGNGTLWEVARERQRLEPQPLALLGDSFADLADRRRRRGALRRLDRGAEGGLRRSRDCRRLGRQPVADFGH